MNLIRFLSAASMQLIVLLLCLAALNVQCYNLSPKPNYIIKDPQFSTSLPKVESSYFGFSLNLRPSGIFVGAPRAQSTLPMQRNVNETGAIYRCSLTASATCNPYVFDDHGNRNFEQNEYTYDSEMRDNQWLGAAMDGGSQDTDKLLVCAPRFMSPTTTELLMNGICYWVPNTLNKDPTNVVKISPLRLRNDQLLTVRNHRYYYYMLAEMGLSAHVTDNNEEFVIGAPGLHTWKGSAIHYRQRTLTDDPSLSRRDTLGTRVARQSAEGQKKHYESDVLRPELWDQLNDSYFGYAVGSGYFDSNDRERLMYVATAPQGDYQSGEAYLYDISGRSITRRFVFRGKKFGEYFGYALLTEDLNGDGLTDVVVSAPQHSISGYNDDGAIYVFTNLGNFNFERKLLTSPVHGNVRFGSTLSKLGDINHDGYKDIAVGAPFAHNGAVFVYLGGESGLREQHSQRLNSPKSVTTKYGEHMFGHGLSKGADIDNNGFNDFAVGAPNAEAVFVYRAYPVVKILATVSSPTREIKPDQRTLKISACYAISTTSMQVKGQDLAMRVVVDAQVKRVMLKDTHTNEISFNATAGLHQQCRVLDAEVNFNVADIFKPIELDIHYDLINHVPDSEVFCDQCVAVDPAEAKVYTEKIIFSTGCKSDICVADLEVKSQNLNHKYVLGSSRTLAVTYVVSNEGETAYLPQINITSTNRLSFSKVPSNCRTESGDSLLCGLNSGQPMAKGAKDHITVMFDVSSISGKTLIITAKVFSTGEELNPRNNEATDVITLSEYTEIDAIGIPKTPVISLEKVDNTSEILNYYEIKSVGPSVVNAMDVIFHIPVAYKVAGTNNTIQIVDMNNINMQAAYDAQLVGIDFYQNNTQIIMNSFELSSAMSSSSSSSSSSSYSSMTYTKVGKTNQNSIHYDTTKMGMFEETTDQDLGTVMSASMGSRRRRREAAAQTATKDQYAKIVKAHELLSEDMKGKLPVNRTIVFNCNDPEMTICVRAVMRVYNFKPEKPITVTMKYQVDLKEINQILIEPWEFFVILIGLNVERVGDLTGKTLDVRKRIEYNIVSKHTIYSLPIWVIILAVLGGLLLLGIIAYILYKTGFFKRAKKEEMDSLVQQNQDAGREPVEPEEENLNTEHN